MFSGSLIIKRENEKSYKYERHCSVYERKTRRPLWFVFAGLGGQWVGMAKSLMPFEVFSKKIEECHQILHPHGIDLKALMNSEEKDSLSIMSKKILAITTLQLAMIDLLKALKINPDGMIGHSFGEIGAAYSTGCITLEQALMAAHLRGVSETDKTIPKGLMAVVGLSWQQVENRCANGIQIVCNNGKNLVVVAGELCQMDIEIFNLLIDSDPIL